MWFSMGYMIPQKGDRGGGGGTPIPTFYLLTQDGNQLITQDDEFMVQEATP